MSETVREKNEVNPLGKFVTSALENYVRETKEAKREALAKRIDGTYRKAFYAHQDSPRAKVFLATHDMRESGTTWVPYTTADTELGEVSVSVRVTASQREDTLSNGINADYALEMRVASEEGSTFDDKLANSYYHSDRFSMANSKVPVYGSTAFGEIETILTHIDNYIDTQTASS